MKNSPTFRQSICKTVAVFKAACNDLFLRTTPYINATKDYMFITHIIISKINHILSNYNR